MNRTKLITVLSGFAIAVAATFFISADHVDAPDVAATTSDIADLYAFQGANTNNSVLIATLQGPLMPGMQTSNAVFDEDVMIQFNIDNTGDFIEDLVIQAVKRGDSMYFFGPAAPAETGLNSSIISFVQPIPVKISDSTDAITNTLNGIQVYAGPRRDPFFFDFNRFNMVASGAVVPEGFLPPGEASDFFENLNVLAVAVEVPNAMLGTAPTHVAVAAGIVDPGTLPNAYNIWVTTKRKIQ